ncbi:hypothetical protein [Absidia glauca]|uniref:Uncharacterized protein n=1 Tax=Absidia glauca TaxID=4829 RepID=A0A168KXE5_ABSGL|nr:hypothetical protein [Absidia glauca]
MTEYAAEVAKMDAIETWQGILEVLQRQTQEHPDIERYPQFIQQRYAARQKLYTFRVWMTPLDYHKDDFDELSESDNF